MPRTTPFIAAVVAALAVAVPTATAEGQPTGAHTAEGANAVTQMLDARERSTSVKQVATPAPDWIERFAAAHSLREPVVDDRFGIDPTAGAAPIAASSGREYEWPQLGVGLLLVLALGLGAYLIARSGRQRPLAH